MTNISNNNDGVSPVVGVMLMLIIVIIIAAVVSAFSGGITESRSKIPQANIKTTFSVSGGMTITHAGGDAIPINDLVFIVQNGDGFGPNAQKSTTQVLNENLITDKDGNKVFSTGYVNGKTSFNPGDTLIISAENSTCYPLQPSISAALIGPTGTTTESHNPDTHCYQSSATYSGPDIPWDYKIYPITYPQPGYRANCNALWQLCFRNPNNIAKDFTFQVSDKDGNLISKSVVKITP